MLSPRARAVLYHPALWVGLVYACGVAVRVLYTLYIQNPGSLIYSDMGIYVGLARRMVAGVPLLRSDVTHPLGYASLLAFLFSRGGSLSLAINFQLVVTCLVPLTIGLLGAAAYGRRTAYLAVVFASLYYPFIEYGALFLSEIHFIFWLTLAFAAFLAARRARRQAVAIGLALGGGLALSVAAVFKSVALPAAFVFFVVEGVALLVARPADGRSQPWSARLRSGLWRLRPWLLRGALVAVAAAPVLGAFARVCTRANDNRFCITGNKMGSDFLLGHYGRVADIEWIAEGHDQFRFGSPGALLRHYDAHKKVPFSYTDNATNVAEAWRWIGKHPGEAIVLSIDHIYDTFFGTSMWPTFNSGMWPFANLFQSIFIALLFVPTLLAFAGVARRGWRALVTSQIALVLAPIVALTITVAVATGEVRYRIPFDVFFIVIACAYASRDLARVDGPDAPR